VIALDYPLEAFRILVISGMAAWMGGLLWHYVLFRRPVRRMVYGAISASLLLATAIFDQIGHIAHPPTWRLPMYAAATGVGLVGLWKATEHPPRRRR
jgi:hypothetical protein